MNFGFLLPLLAMFTFLAAIVFAIYSQKKTLERKRDPNAPKSSLAVDGPGPSPFRAAPTVEDTHHKVTPTH